MGYLPKTQIREILHARGVEMGQTYTVRLTRQQHNAMMLVLIEQIRDSATTQEFVDVLTDSTVTVGELLQLVSNAEVS